MNRPSRRFRLLLAAVLITCSGDAPRGDGGSPQLADGSFTAEFVVFEASGHFAPVEQPETFRETVFGFLGVGD